MRVSLWRCVLFLAVLSLVGVDGLSDGCSITVQPGESIQAAIDGASEGAVVCLSGGSGKRI